MYGRPPVAPGNCNWLTCHVCSAGHMLLRLRINPFGQRQPHRAPVLLVPVGAGLRLHGVPSSSPSVPSVRPLCVRCRVLPCELRRRISAPLLHAAQIVGLRLAGRGPLRMRVSATPRWRSSPGSRRTPVMDSCLHGALVCGRGRLRVGASCWNTSETACSLEFRCYVKISCILFCSWLCDVTC